MDHRYHQLSRCTPAYSPSRWLRLVMVSKHPYAQLHWRLVSQELPGAISSTICIFTLTTMDNWCACHAHGRWSARKRAPDETFRLRRLRPLPPPEAEMREGARVDVEWRCAARRSLQAVPSHRHRVHHENQQRRQRDWSFHQRPTIATPTTAGSRSRGPRRPRTKNEMSWRRAHPRQPHYRPKRPTVVATWRYLKMVSLAWLRIPLTSSSILGSPH